MYLIFYFSIILYLAEMENQEKMGLLFFLVAMNNKYANHNPFQIPTFLY